MSTGPSLDIVQVVCTDAFAGVERYVVSLARGLSAAGHTVTVLGGEGARMTGELSGTRVRWLPAASATAALAGLARQRGADIVHAHMTSAETAAVLGKPIHRAAIVSTRHFARTRGSSTAAKLVGRVVSRAISAQIAVSGYVASAVEGAATVVFTGVADAPQPLPATQRDRTVLVVSRLEAEKRVDVALRVWAASGLADLGWELAVAGDGAQRTALQRLASELDLKDRCRFLGARTDVPQLLDRASLLLAPCPVEAFGLAVVEAMAHGLPVVAVSRGAHAEILGRSKQAALFDVEDPLSGARLLAKLAADPGARTRYGADLRRIQQQTFDIARQIEQTEQVYRAVLR